MIERYNSHIIDGIWNEQAKFDRWAEIEVAACRVYHERGEISIEDMDRIETAEFPSAHRIKEIEKETDHDVVAFIKAFCENIGGDSGRHIHKGLTSSDICDTAQAMAMRDSVAALLRILTEFIFTSIRPLAEKFKHTPCIGRTHGVHAEITTFGLRVLGWFAELMRCRARLLEVYYSVRHAKLSGAVGTYSQTDPEFESHVLNRLKLFVEPVSTQIVPRDRYADLLSALSLLGGAFERIALEIRSLQRTEIREVEEGFKKGQTGSSAMPHKRNPISSEKICGLARLLRGNMIVAFENMALWHDRDISHSSAERVILPDSFHIVFHMLDTMKKIFDNLQVFPLNMEDNIWKTGGLVFSQNVLGYYLSKGMSREVAYKKVQEAAYMVWNKDFVGKNAFMQALLELTPMTDPTPQEISEFNKCFDVKQYLRYVDDIFDRMLKRS